MVVDHVQVEHSRKNGEETGSHPRLPIDSESVSELDTKSHCKTKVQLARKDLFSSLRRRSIMSCARTVNPEMKYYP